MLFSSKLMLSCPSSSHTLGPPMPLISFKFTADLIILIPNCSQKAILGWSRWLSCACCEICSTAASPPPSMSVPPDHLRYPAASLRPRPASPSRSSSRSCGPAARRSWWRGRRASGCSGVGSAGAPGMKIYYRVFGRIHSRKYHWPNPWNSPPSKN